MVIVITRPCLCVQPVWLNLYGVFFNIQLAMCRTWRQLSSALPSIPLWLSLKSNVPAALNNKVSWTAEQHLRYTSRSTRYNHNIYSSALCYFTAWPQRFYYSFISWIRTGKIKLYTNWPLQSCQSLSSSIFTPVFWIKPTKEIFICSGDPKVTKDKNAIKTWSRRTEGFAKVLEQDDTRPYF